MFGYHLGSVQPLARLLVALRRWHTPTQLVHRPRRARELRPALRQVPADIRRAAVSGFRRASPLGVSPRLLDGTTGLRRLVHIERRPAPQRFGAPAREGVPLGGTRRVLVARHVSEYAASD